MSLEIFNMLKLKFLPPLMFWVTVILISGSIGAPVLTRCWSLFTTDRPLIEITGSASRLTNMEPLLGLRVSWKDE